MRIAVIGSGLSGSLLAHHCTEFAEVTVYEKARGPGGRLSTRYGEGVQYDHGAPYFTTENQHFTEFLNRAKRQEVVTSWACRVQHAGPNSSQEGQTVWVAIPKMNRLCRYLLEPVRQQHYRTKVVALCRSGLQLADATQPDTYDWVVVTVPRTQLLDLMPASLQADYAWLGAAKTLPQSVLMVQLSNWQPAFDVLLPHHPVVEKIVMDAHKPGRQQVGCAVVYAHSAWSADSQEKSAEERCQLLLDAFIQVSGVNESQVLDAQWHHWRLAKDLVDSTSPVLVNRSWRHVYIGDWLSGGDVSGAYQSALAGVDFLKKESACESL
jgi:renalase